GLKENVILGHLIPAGTGFTWYSQARLQRTLTLEEGMAEYEAAFTGMPHPEPAA
ncbi:MAG: hypothetical protein HC813_02900, partial [Planctomycetes bacterium]|nr:hypothetical protein [Planctomycetota bacterium]